MSFLNNLVHYLEDGLKGAGQAVQGEVGGIGNALARMRPSEAVAFDKGQYAQPLNGSNLNLSGGGLSLDSFPGLSNIQHLNGPSQPIPLTRQVQFGQNGNPVNIPAYLGGRVYEDSALVNGSQGPVPGNMSVANFQGSPGLQGNQYNPGYSPLQNSFGPSPQQGAFQDQAGQLNARRFNPQNPLSLY